jgi:outer membrane immunogenic protein
MKKLASTTAMLGLLAAAPAHAGALIFDAPEPEPIAAPAPVAPAAPLALWTGPYAGAQLGWGRFEGDVDTALGSVSPRDDALIGGFHAGYDWQFENGFVLGGEAAYDRTNADGSSGDARVELDNVVRLTARAGFGFGNSLVYARGGAAWLDGDVTVDGVRSSESDWGWVAGAGFEQRLTPNVSAGIEALYHDASSFGAADADLTTVQARLSWRF